MKRVIIVHGWDGYPEEGWFPWLKKELEVRGFEVVIPQLPQADEPRINRWVPALAAVVGTPDDETCFVGHSMGCQAIARYLESLPEGVTAGGAVFVAGFFRRLTNLEDDQAVRDVAREWLETPLDLAVVRRRIKRCVALFSDNDPYVPLDNQEDFAKILEAKIVVKHGQGHFSGSTGTTELPAALEAILEIAD
jgi:hypothetical protein